METGNETLGIPQLDPFEINSLNIDIHHEVGRLVFLQCFSNNNILTMYLKKQPLIYFTKYLTKKNKYF